MAARAPGWAGASLLVGYLYHQTTVLWWPAMVLGLGMSWQTLWVPAGAFALQALGWWIAAPQGAPTDWAFRYAIGGAPWGGRLAEGWRVLPSLIRQWVATPTTALFALTGPLFAAVFLQRGRAVPRWIPAWMALHMAFFAWWLPAWRWFMTPMMVPLALVVSLTKFCKAIGLGPRELCNPRYIIRSLSQAMTLKHLGGGHGDGCNSADDAFSNQRRLFHHLTMWGFMLCFAATCVATIYEYFLGRMSPFPLLSVPVVLGSSGGLGLLVGCSGLFVTKLKTATAPLHLAGLGMDYAFLNLLFWISVTGFALLWWRDSTAMGILLAIHLGFVLAFFVTLPYSNFVHGAYRWLALVKYTADEANRP